MNRKTFILLFAGLLIAGFGGVLLWDDPEPGSGPVSVEAGTGSNPVPDASAISAEPSGSKPGASVLEQTRAWLGDLRGRDGVTQEWLVEGERILTNRRELLKSLIIVDPEQALEQALSDAERSLVPDELRHLLEQPVHGVGDLNLVIACGEDHPPGEHPTSETWREVHMAEKILKAHVYGNRNGMQTLVNVPLHGIAIDGEMAVAESPMQVIEVAADGAVRARFGEHDLTFPSRSAFDEAAEAVLAAERAHEGPVVTYPDLTSFTQP